MFIISGQLKNKFKNIEAQIGDRYIKNAEHRPGTREIKTTRSIYIEPVSSSATFTDSYI